MEMHPRTLYSVLAATPQIGTKVLSKAVEVFDVSWAELLPGGREDKSPEVEIIEGLLKVHGPLAVVRYALDLHERHVSDTATDQT